MHAGDQRARALDRACVDYMEAACSTPRVGQVFDAVVVQRRGDAYTVQLADPPARVTAAGDGLEIGRRARLRLATADPATRQVRFVARVAPAIVGAPDHLRAATLVVRRTSRPGGRGTTSHGGVEESPDSTGQGGG